MAMVDRDDGCRIRTLLAVCALFLLLFVLQAAAQTGKAAASATEAPEPLPLTPQDLARDPCLAVSVTENVKSRTLQEWLSATKRATGVSLEIDPALGEQRVTIFPARNPLHRIMTAVAAVTALAWSKPSSADATQSQSDSPSGYRLFQTEAARKHDESLIAASARREEQGRTAKREALLESVRTAIARRSPDKPSIADLLASLTPAQLTQAAELAALPEGIISASDQSHLHPHVLFATPFRQLAPALQASVRAMLDRPEYSSDQQEGRFAAALEDMADLERSHVAVVAASGSLRLGIIGPEGKDVWVSPFDAVWRRGIPKVDSDIDIDPEVEEAFRIRKLLDITEMPPAFRRKRLRFPASLTRTQLPEVLESISSQTGLAIVSDDFLRSRTTFYHWLLTDKTEYTLEEALHQVAGAFGRRLTYRDGILRVQTLTRGLDLRAEPPVGLVPLLQAKAKKNQPLVLDDYLDLARLSDLQLLTLQTCKPPVVPQGSALFAVQKLHRILAYYARLSPEEKEQAESEEGLKTRDMDLKLLREFRMLADAGLPSRADLPASPRRAGLYVHRERLPGGTGEVTFLIVSSADPPRMTAYHLAVR